MKLGHFLHLDRIIGVILIAALGITSVPVINASATKLAYKELYGEYLREHGYATDLLMNGDNAKNAFVYIDTDNIPELIIDGGSVYNTGLIFTIYDGAVKEITPDEGTAIIKYKKKSGKFYTGGGHTGTHYCSWYILKNGKVKCYASGSYTDAIKNGNVKGKTDCTWLGKAVSVSRYTSLAKKYNKSSKKWIKVKTKNILDTGLDACLYEPDTTR